MPFGSPPPSALTSPVPRNRVSPMIRLGIIGTGGMAHGHAKSFTTMKGVSVTACCDIDEARARAFAKTFSIPRWYTDYREMLDSEKLDAVTNVTIDPMHAPI